jgi:transcription-repair coupling factor (superfamily II helicase)
VSEAALRRVLERVAPSLRASVASGSFVASSYFATPLAVAAWPSRSNFVVGVTATSTEAEHVARRARRPGLGDTNVALWPAWDTHPLERVSPDSQVMALRIAACAGAS